MISKDSIQSQISKVKKILEHLTQKKWLLATLIAGVIIFTTGLGVSLLYEPDTSDNDSTSEQSTGLGPLSATNVVESEEEVFEYDYEGLFITSQLQSEGFQTGLISSENNSELGFDYPITLSPEQEEALEIQFNEQSTTSLDELIPVATQRPITNRLVWPEYGVDAPLIYSSLFDLFIVENGLINFNSYVDNNPTDSPIQTKLTQGVVHLAYTPLPGEIGNSYIVGHSSNFSSVISDYNEVFAPLTRQTKPGEIFTIYDHHGRELRFRVFEAIEVRTEDVGIAYNEYPKDKRVVTLQGSILERVNGRLQPTKRWITRGELIRE
jgi:hypothetical protein